MGENRAGELLGQLLKRYKLEAGLRRGRVLALWPEIAGEMLARLTEPIRLERGELLVRAESAALAHQLTYQREELLRRYAAKLGEDAVREIRFVTGRPRKPGGEPEGPRAPEPAALPLEQAKRLERWVAAVPEELGAAVERAGRAVLAAQSQREGDACAICGRSGEATPCRFCAALLEDPLVKKTAQRIAREPEAAPLEGDLLAAARWLATERLRGQIDELAPQAAEASELRPLFDELVDRYARIPRGASKADRELARLSPAARALAGKR